MVLRQLQVSSKKCFNTMTTTKTDTTSFSVSETKEEETAMSKKSKRVLQEAID